MINYVHGEQVLWAAEVFGKITLWMANVSQAN